MSPNSPAETSTLEAPPFDDLLNAFRRRLDDALAAWIAERRTSLAGRAPGSEILADEVARLVGVGGKRLRPALLHFAYRACGGEDDDATLAPAMAVELLHTYLLIHDDIMDHAPLRRGAASVHARIEALHGERGWDGDGADHGRSVAILVGDLAHTWAVELARAVPAAAPAEADPAAVAATFDAMCEEVIAGQHLEMTLPLSTPVDGPPDEEQLMRILRLKSGRYSVERPVELGARLAAASPDVLAILTRWGSLVGEAFQLQDDLLGTFGDDDATGKSSASDLAEGKITFLVHHALTRAPTDDAAWLSSILGRGELSADEVHRARSVITASGARARVQAMVDERLDAAGEEIAGLDLAEDGRIAFEGFVDLLRGRDR